MAFIGNVGRNIQHTLDTMDTVLGEEDACRWAERNTDAFAIVNWRAGVVGVLMGRRLLLLPTWAGSGLESTAVQQWHCREPAGRGRRRRARAYIMVKVPLGLCRCLLLFCASFVVFVFCRWC